MNKNVVLFLGLILLVSFAAASSTDLIDSTEDWQSISPYYTAFVDTYSSDGSILVNQSGGAQAGSFLWIASASPNNYVTKIDTITNTIVGRFRTDPSSSGDPSRTAVDSDGYVWVGSRASPYGVAKIAPDISLCIDRNLDGNITTSNSTSILPWGTDECVVGYMATPADIRPLAVDLNGHVWFGSYIGNWVREITNPDNFNNLSISYTQYTSYGIGGYGAAIDSTGKIWFSQTGQVSTRIGYIDTNTKVIKTYTGGCGGYGLNTYSNYALRGCTNSGGTGFTVFTANPSTGDIELVKNIPGGTYTRALQYHSIRNSIFYGNFNNGYIYEYNITPGADPWVLSTADFVVDAGTDILGCVVDAQGYVWVTDYTPGIIRKIDPATKTVIASVSGVPAPYTYSDATGSNLFQYITTGTWHRFYQGAKSEYMKIEWVESNNPESRIKAYYDMQGFSHPVRVFSGSPFSVDTYGKTNTNVEFFFEITTNSNLSSPYIDSLSMCETDYRCEAYGSCVDGWQSCLTAVDDSACGMMVSPNLHNLGRACGGGGAPLPATPLPSLNDTNPLNPVPPVDNNPPGTNPGEPPFFGPINPIFPPIEWPPWLTNPIELPPWLVNPQLPPWLQIPQFDFSKIELVGMVRDMFGIIRKEIDATLASPVRFGITVFVIIGVVVLGTSAAVRRKGGKRK